MPSFRRLIPALFALNLVFSSTGWAQAGSMNAGQDKYGDISYPRVNYGVGAQAEQIKRGEYLARAGGCVSCHTIPGGKPFAGGLAMTTPFGTIYSPNITPDPKTGIGNWTDKEFDRALRQGISEKGHFYYPVFPFPYFNKLSTQDVQAIFSYLKAIPAVKQKNIPLDMPFPFRWRELLRFWRFMFFDFNKGTFTADPGKSVEWNRGAYLVQGLGHCGMCHSPLNPLGAPIRKYEYAGGFVEGYHAPNISASGLKGVPAEKVLDVFLNDKMIHGGDIHGPMLQVNHDSLRYLSREDLTSIVSYLRSVNSKVPPATRIATGPETGEGVYKKYCAGCHNMGAGAPRLGDSATWTALVKLGMPQLYQNAITGIRGMPPKGGCSSCNDEQVKAAVDYIVKESTGEGAKQTAAAAAAPALKSQTSLERGQQVYNQVCSICHNEGLLGSPKLGDQTAWTPLLKLNLDVLVQRSINGYKKHPPRGACYHCSDGDIIAAVKYMAQASSKGNNYQLW